jgi:hypothetical protein
MELNKIGKSFGSMSEKLKTLDSKYNDYNGRYQGRVLNVRQWSEHGCVPNPDGFGRIMEYPNKRFVLMTSERYYKQFCQLDHYINDRAFMKHLRELVSTSQTSDEGITEHKSIIELWCKVRDITLTDNFQGFPSKQGYSVMSGNFLTQWELDKMKSFRKEYVEFVAELNEYDLEYGKSFNQNLKMELEDLNDIEEWEYRQDLENYYEDEDNDDYDALSDSELPF